MWSCSYLSDRLTVTGMNRKKTTLGILCITVAQIPLNYCSGWTCECVVRVLLKFSSSVSGVATVSSSRIALNEVQNSRRPFDARQYTS